MKILKAPLAHARGSDSRPIYHSVQIRAARVSKRSFSNRSLSKRSCFNKIFLIILSTLTPLFTYQAHADNLPLLSVPINIKDKPSLQRGAKIFMNYCSGCHSLRYLRYNRMAQDLGLTTFTGALDEPLLYSNLIFTSAKAHDPIAISMPEKDARQWFGLTPPDLSLVARKRGASWVYTYLHSFYEDKQRPFGANNLLVPKVAMPDVLYPLRGRVVVTGETDLLWLGEGEMSEQEFEGLLQDLVNFLVYVGEPAQLVRYRLGVLVLIYLFIFFVITYRLKKNYWQDLSPGSKH